MEELSLYLRLLLAGLFLSAGLEKLRAMERHKSIVRDYRLLPERWVGSFAVAEVWGELALGCLLAAGLFVRFSLVAAVVMFGIYSVAIGVNLLRGRREISCGCGGVAGDQPISRWLVLRNLLLMTAAAWVWQNPPLLGSLDAQLGTGAADLWGLYYWIVLLLVIQTLLLAVAFQEMAGIKKRVAALLAAVRGI